MKNKRRLVSKSMLTADMFYYDMISGQQSILGLFTSKTALSFPYVHPFFCVCATLTNGEGEAEIAAIVVSTDRESGEEVELYRRMETVSFDHPLETVAVEFLLAGLHVPEPGEYRVRLVERDYEIEERRLVFAQFSEGDDDA